MADEKLKGKVIQSFSVGGIKNKNGSWRRKPKTYKVGDNYSTDKKNEKFFQSLIDKKRIKAS